MEEVPKTSAQRGVRTFFQAVLASVTGLLLAIWNTPGVPDTISNYAQQHWLPLLLAFVGMIGVPAGIIAYIQNRLEGNK